MPLPLSDIAKKRLIVESESGRAARESKEKDELTDRSESFGEWARSTYAKYWFILLALVVNVFGGLEVADLLKGEVGTVAAIVFIVLAIVAEFYLWRHLWPKEEDKEEG